MRLRMFQSDKGDCLLLSDGQGANILADGGMGESYRTHVAPYLGRMATRNEALDLVYVSHIDEDHIAGILQLVDDMVEWKVYDFQRSSGNTGFPKPARARPPQVEKVWHNGFHDQVEDNVGDIEKMLITRMKSFVAADRPRDARANESLVTSVRQGLMLTQRLDPSQLGIPLNPEFGGGLMYVADPPDRIRIGTMTISILGPFKKELEDLRKLWNDWLADNGAAVERLRDQARRDAARLDQDELTLFQSMMRDTVDAFDGWSIALGHRNKVTVPNLASLTLLVEDSGKSMLLTGDALDEDIVAGLESNGKLDAQGKIHVDVLKVQHHGSEHNLDLPFCQTVTADHYVFCGNGAHENPDLRVLKDILKSRLGPNAIQPKRKFKFWFNSSSKVTQGDEKKHMQAVESLIRSEARRTKGRMRYRFLTSGSSIAFSV